MKFGILTYHAPCNFGANLQAYSSACFFASFGYDVKVINYVSSEYRSPYYCDKAQFMSHWRFSQEKLPVTRLVEKDELVSLIEEEKIDVIVLGADAIWNKNVLDVFGLSWLWKSRLANQIKVVCLSPAFMGNTYLDLPLEKRNEFKDSLQRMLYVNTRDEWTKSVINKEIMGYDFIERLNPDPVFLLNDFCNTEWKKENKLIESKKYYIVSLQNGFVSHRSILKKSWLMLLKFLVNRKGYKLVELPIPEGVSDFKFDYTVPYPIDPLQWYLWLKNAKGFIGLRFHAVVSCISAGTPFFSLDSYGKSSFIIRCLNVLGIHCFDRRLNVSSKIRNLLEGSGLETYRINGSRIHMVSPFKILRMLDNLDPQIILGFKEKNVLKFKKNMAEMLSILREYNA